MAVNPMTSNYPPKFALGSKNWCEFASRDSRESELSEESVECGDRNLARRSDLDADGPTGPREIDEHPGLRASGADAFLSGPTGEGIISRNWPSASKRDFDVPPFHLTAACFSRVHLNAWVGALRGLLTSV